MVKLRRMVAFAVFVCIVAGSYAVGSAGYGYDWRMPQPLASTDAAITAIKDLRGFMALDANYATIQDLSIDAQGLSITFIYGNNARRLGVMFNQLIGFEQMYDIDGRLYSFIYLRPGQSIQIASPAHGRKLIDAMATLAIAQNAPLLPYHDFSVARGSEGYLEMMLKKAKVTAGAVVHSGAPNSPLTGEDVIIQATYAGKVVPITGFDSWDAACREAAAGKAEEIIQVRFIRNGATLDKEVKLINYSFLKPAQNEAAPSAPPKGFGIELRLMDAAELKAVGLERAVGFLVVSVAKGSNAEKMQLKAGDVLLAINGIDITSTQLLIEAMGKGPIVSVKFWRDGVTATSQATLAF